MWDEITYPFLNFKGATVEVEEWISNSIPHFTGRVITYTFKLNHVSKSGLRCIREWIGAIRCIFVVTGAKGVQMMPKLKLYDDQWHAIDTINWH